jgi:hypothetical protein
MPNARTLIHANGKWVSNARYMQEKAQNLSRILVKLIIALISG